MSVPYEEDREITVGRHVDRHAAWRESFSNLVTLLEERNRRTEEDLRQLTGEYKELRKDFNEEIEKLERELEEIKRSVWIATGIAIAISLSLPFFQFYLSNRDSASLQQQSQQKSPTK